MAFVFYELCTFKPDRDIFILRTEGMTVLNTSSFFVYTNELANKVYNVKISASAIG